MNSSSTSLCNPKVLQGQTLVYRIFDVAEEINLSTVERIIQRTKGESRLTIAKSSRNAVVVRNPPVRLALGEQTFRILDNSVTAECFATLWDYGVVSILFQIPIAPGTPWTDLSNRTAILNGDIPGAEEIDNLARTKTHDLARQLAEALKRPRVWDTFEDYVIYFFEKLDGVEQTSDLIKRSPLAELTLGEPMGRLSDKSQQGIAEHSYQYAANDLVAIDWNCAVVVEPSGQRDIPQVIEFSLTHLLEFRYYDGLLDQRLSELYDSIEAGRNTIWHSSFAKISKEANTRFIEFSEFIERVDNSLKVVGDFYVATIYRAAIRRFRIQDWEQSITRKMNLLARVAELLQGEINVHRAHMLELVIIFLIAFEIVSAILKGLG